MSKIHIDRLKKKYDGVKVSGSVYSDLVKQIVDNNTANVERSMYRKSKKKWEDFAKKRFRTDREIRLVLPSAEDVIPPRALQLRKAAEKGELITDTLRDRLTGNLRKTLLEFDEESFITRRGAKAGRINPKLVDKFEKDIRKTFENYSKKDPKIGVPKNVREIAVTEMRGAINDVKDSFTERMIENNPDLILKKKWIQNKHLSKVPRRGHSVVDNKVIDYDDFFKVPLYIERGGRLRKIGATLMRRPHDPTAPLEQNINCHCDYDVIVLKKKRSAV